MMKIQQRPFSNFISSLIIPPIFLLSLLQVSIFHLWAVFHLRSEKMAAIPSSGSLIATHDYYRSESHIRLYAFILYPFQWMGKCIMTSYCFFILQQYFYSPYGSLLQIDTSYMSLSFLFQGASGPTPATAPVAVLSTQERSFHTTQV